LVVPSCEHQNTILKKHKVMSQKKRTDKSSTTAAVQGFAGVMSYVPLPDGEKVYFICRLTFDGFSGNFKTGQCSGHEGDPKTGLAGEMWQ
jgi:hypothetical protein